MSTKEVVQMAEQVQLVPVGDTAVSVLYICAHQLSGK